MINNQHARHSCFTEVVSYPCILITGFSCNTNLVQEVSGVYVQGRVTPGAWLPLGVTGYAFPWAARVCAAAVFM
jgi:hypothetical protein